MHPLDDSQAMKSLDKSELYSHLIGLSEQFTRAWFEAKKVILPSTYFQIHNVVILGMGGSAIGGGLVQSLSSTRQRVPVFVLRDYNLPGFVDHNSLIIAVTYSGNTEETVGAFREALAKGAKAIAITSGGEIESIANRARAPLYKIEYNAPPRAAWGYLFIPLLLIFSKLGLLEFGQADLEAIVATLNEQVSQNGIEVPFAKNPTKKLAVSLQEKIIVTIGSGVMAEVARRWKTQINENAKQTAYVEALPELCHNSIVGLERPKAIGKELFYILFSSRFDHPRNTLRTQLLAAAIARRGIPYEIIESNASSPAAAVAQLVMQGDFVSYYLAILNRVDPTPVEPIEYLKKELAKHQ